MIGDRHDENGFAARVDLARTAPFSLGGMQVVPASRTVAVEGRKLVLEPRVMQVLVVLAQAAGEVVSRDELISRCWAGAVVGDDSINRVIFRLRRLAEETKSFRIETVARVGYRLEPLVATQAGGSGQPSSPTLVSALNPARSSWRSRFVWATCLVGAAGAGAVAYWLTAHDPPVTPVIAVLPFTDRSPNGAQKYLAEGVAEDVLTLLSGDSGLRVIGESSVKQLQTLGRATGPDARRLLAATHIVEGAVASDGARLRVTVRLIETQEGEPLWAEEFDGKPAEVFRIQEQIASAVSRRVQGTFAALKSKEFRRLSTSPEVYRLYVTAKGVLRRRDYRSLLLAEHSLRQALYLDDQYAPAHALMAITVDLLDQVRPSGMEQNRAADRDRARAFALRSIELACGRPCGARDGH
jgi:TolB-like protein/DNA-binding winged helix-turn-helix (wHTH) protein